MGSGTTRAHVAILRRRVHDDDLQTDVLTTWGYRAECPCSWRGKRRFTMNVARADLTMHKVEAHGHKLPRW